MGLLYLLSCWLYGADVAALSDPIYAVRAAAHQRLQAAGWMAFGAVWQGGTTAESAERCELLAERLPGVSDLIRCYTDREVERYTASPWEVPELTPSAWLLLEPAVCRAAVTCGGVWVTNPQTNNSSRLTYDAPAGYAHWCRSPQFYAGSREGEVRLLAESVRLHRQGR